MKLLRMEFNGYPSLCLSSTEFAHPIRGVAKQMAVRGKDGGAYRGASSFQWTSGVVALCLLLIRAKLNYLRYGNSSLEHPQLIGGRKSFASALDSAISKECNWLAEMFGTDSLGRLIVLRMIRRSNPNMKRPGPVSLALSTEFLEPNDVLISVDSIELGHDIGALEKLLSSLESARPQHGACAANPGFDRFLADHRAA